jgi:DNA adenine methylase
MVKWAGGKTSSAEVILQSLPPMIETYYEPFFGGGAILFALARSRRFKRAVVGDINKELLEAHAAVRDDLPGVCRALVRLGLTRVSREKYYRVRESQPRTRAGRAARMLFLNRTGYNGLYRVNLNGGYNVPYGNHSSCVIDYANLEAVSLALRSVRLIVGDFTEICEGAEPGDAVYFDPPYLPESKTARFTAYSAGGFSLGDHRRLGRTYEALAVAGVHVVASNAAVRGAEKIYERIPGTEIYEVPVARAINSNGKRRGRVGELLIINRGSSLGESRSNGN